MKLKRKSQCVNKIKIAVIAFFVVLLLTPAISMSQQYIETHLLDIEIASEDMFIDSSGDILIIGSSDVPTAKSIYLLPSGNYTNPNVLLTGLGRTWSITRSGNDIYFGRSLDFGDGDLRRFNISNPVGTLSTLSANRNANSISVGMGYLYYADTWGGPWGGGGPPASNGVVGRIDLTSETDEILISNLNSPIAVRYHTGSNKLYFLEGGTSAQEFKDGTLKALDLGTISVATLLTNLEYPKGLWVKGDKV
jgi:hypothetical protein